ncbi:hypothetical protein ACFL5P_00495 [candidate division KSB1 bacterium]
MNLESIMFEKGFEIEDTGGGFSAFRKDITEDEYILITKENDPTIPTDITDRVMIGYYMSENDSQLKSESSILSEFIEKIS